MVVDGGGGSLQPTDRRAAALGESGAALGTGGWSDFMAAEATG